MNNLDNHKRRSWYNHKSREIDFEQQRYGDILLDIIPIKTQRDSLIVLVFNEAGDSLEHGPLQQESRGISSIWAFYGHPLSCHGSNSVKPPSATYMSQFLYSWRVDMGWLIWRLEINRSFCKFVLFWHFILGFNTCTHCVFHTLRRVPSQS